MSSNTYMKEDMQYKNQLILKPIAFSYPLNINFVPTNLEYENLKDLRNLAIKELTINYDEISMSHKNRLELTNLLSNTNIKKIKFNFMSSNLKNIMSLIFISKLLRKNSSNKEIELYFPSINNSNGLNKFQILTWTFFLNIIKSSITGISYSPFTIKHTDMNKLLFSNSNLKAISLSFNYLDDPIIVEYILSSSKNLNDFSIKSLNIGLKFFDFISNSETKAEINTLKLFCIKHDSFLDFIDKAYLFKTETIKIEDSEIRMNEIINRILKLSNNPLNTVKRVIIDKCHYNFIDILSELLNFNKYDAKRIPRIFIDYYKELKIEFNNIDKTYIIDYSYKNCEYNYNDFNLTFKGNYLDEYRFTELLYILSNCTEKFVKFYIESDMNDILKTTNSSFIENTGKLVDQMKRIFKQFKDSNIHYKNLNTNYVTFLFNKIHPEFNIFYFTILEIIVQMKIRIDVLRIDCPIIELVNFMDKHQTLESLNIKNIEIIITKINLEDIDKLYQYSNLIEGQIKLEMEGGLYSRKEILNTFVKLTNKSNFVLIYENHRHSSLQDDYAYFDSKESINSYIKNYFYSKKKKKREFLSFNIQELDSIK